MSVAEVTPGRASAAAVVLGMRNMQVAAVAGCSGRVSRGHGVHWQRGVCRVSTGTLAVAAMALGVRSTGVGAAAMATCRGATDG